MNPIDLLPISRSGVEPLVVNQETALGAFLLSPDNLTDDDHRHWHDLGDASDGSNIFTQPWFLSAAITACDPSKAVRLAIVRAQSGAWLAVFPLVRRAMLGRVPLPHWQLWQHHNQFLGTPLIRAGYERVAWDAMLTLANAHAGRERIVALFAPTLASEDASTIVLETAAAAQGTTALPQQSYARAMLGVGDGFTVPPLPGKRAARLRTLTRRLRDDHPDMAIEWLSPSGDMSGWVDAFLRLEAMGWKGAAGSCLSAQAATATLFRAVTASAHAQGALRLVRLRVGGRTIAMSSYFIDRGHGFGFKQAFDPSFAAYAPGLLLLKAITEDTSRRSEPLMFDSCSAPGETAVNSMWPGRRRIVDLLLPVGGTVGYSIVATVLAARGLVRQLRG
jgi:CelD/BcsL family acetyltransferase involved in cellulose biosynthesis